LKIIITKFCLIIKKGKEVAYGLPFVYEIFGIGGDWSLGLDLDFSSQCSFFDFAGLILEALPG